MTASTQEPRFPLALTQRQLQALTGYLDTVSTSEADPDAEVFALIDQVRQVRKLAATGAPIQIEQNQTARLASTPTGPSDPLTLTLNAEAVAALAHYWKALDACPLVNDETVSETEKTKLYQASEHAAIELGALVAGLAPVHLYKSS
ncbi:hypothetical protein M1D58_27470 (plasmid) [Pseudomonas sp. R4-76]|uniref:hypothetical protein n=1 Tax=unclassified Pseudomonas TaxID=196821 RepID=UPI003DA86F64